MLNEERLSMNDLVHRENELNNVFNSNSFVKGAEKDQNTLEFIKRKLKIILYL